MLLLGSVTIQPFGFIVASSPAVRSFDLTSFYFGCVIDTHVNGVTEDIGCTIAVTGYFADGKGIAPVQTYSFAPTKGALQASPLNKAVLPATFAGLVNVTFGVADMVGAATVLIVDDLAHCNHA